MAISPNYGTTKQFSTAQPTTTAAQLLPTNDKRVSVLIWNNGTATVYLGNDATVTPTTGFPLGAGLGLEDNQSSDPWWAVTSSGTGDLRIVKVTV